MVTNDPGNTIKVYYVDGLPGTGITINTVSFPISPTNTPPGAIQPGTTTRLNTNDARIHYGGIPVLDIPHSSAIISLAFNDACTLSGDPIVRSCFRLVQLDIDSGATIQDIDAGNLPACTIFIQF